MEALVEGGPGADCSGSGTFHEGELAIADQIVAYAVRDDGIDPHRICAEGLDALESVGRIKV